MQYFTGIVQGIFRGPDQELCPFIVRVVINGVTTDLPATAFQVEQALIAEGYQVSGYTHPVTGETEYIAN